MFLNNRFLKNRKGGANILLEFIALLPFFFIVILLLVDILKFYYMYNVTEIAAYNAAYRFSLTADIEEAMDAADSSFAMGVLTTDTFKSNDVQAWMYQYSRNNNRFEDTSNISNKYKINKAKTDLEAPINGLTVNYDNQRMIDREIWGFQFKLKCNLLVTKTAEKFSGGLIQEQSIDVIANNHVFELQRHDNTP